MSDTKRARYTLEFKMEAVRLVRGGQAASVTAKVLGIPNQTRDNWLRLDGKGKPVSAEQMELARLRAELARVKMERDILKKRRRTLQGRPREVRLGEQSQKTLAGVLDV